MPLIPALGRQRQIDLCEFEASLVYKASSRTARAVTTKNPVSKNKTKEGGEHRQKIDRQAERMRVGGRQEGRKDRRQRGPVYAYTR